MALAIVDNRVERVFHISSGSYGRTPSGAFHVYRKERLSWSVPFSTWMPFASYFVGGIAFHAYPSVPAYPASHGCVRMMARDTPLMYTFATYRDARRRDPGDARVSPVRVLAGAVLLLALALPAAAFADDTPPPSTPPGAPGSLVVALGLQSAVLQAGVVRGRDVILARGFEVELARTLARRLGGHVERFVYVPSQTRLLASSGGGWQLALAGIEPSARAGPART